jgi:hypothetical protein
MSDDDIRNLFAMFAPLALALPPPPPPAHRYRACPSPDRPELMLYRWSDPADGQPGGWVPDSAALLSYRAGSLRLYRLRDADDAIVAMTPTTGRIFIYPQMNFAERAGILSTGPWIPNESVRSIWSDELDSVVAADSGGPPPQPPGAGAAAAAGAESQPPRAPSVALAALVAAEALEVPAAAAAFQWPPAEPTPPQQHHHHHHHHLWDPPLLDWSAVAAPILVQPSLAAINLLLEAAALAPRPAPSAPAAPDTRPLPKHIATIVLERAAADGTLCPITMEPITPLSGVVSSCGHVFQAAALKEWLSGHSTCPECRQPCCI